MITAKRGLGLGAAMLCICLALASAQVPAGSDPTASLPDGLYADKAPLAAASFVGLAEGSFAASGKPYFGGMVFHRVEPGLVIQGGDPTGTGTGGPGYQFRNEIDPSLSFSAAGVLGMANAGPNTNGSQFFITLGAAKPLDGSYTIFGRVASGMDAVKAIRKGDAMSSVRIYRKGERARAFKLGAGQDIPGFDAAVAAMSHGERRIIVIPPELAYGSRCAGKAVPGNAVLVFEIELLAS